MPITTCVFDAYGTLFDVSAAARDAAAEPGRAALTDRWQALARDWRAKQLEYSWLRAIMGDHCPFWQVTQDSLDWALEANGLDGDPALRDRLLALYRGLSAFPEVADMLAALKLGSRRVAILSNGSPDMLESAVRSAGIGDFVDAVLSVETVGVFKPAEAVYDMVGAHLKVARSEVLFVSSNGWDVAAAARYGFATAWVNRADQPVDRVGGQPDHVCHDLTPIPGIADA